MSTNRAAAASTNGAPAERSYFEQQREELFSEIAQSMEHVLQNINRLNRSLESVIAVGNEFGSVEALWSQFEGVMANDPNAAAGESNNEEGETTTGVDDTSMMKEEKA